MDPKKTAVYEKVCDTSFMGCTLSPREGMTAMHRMHWLTPTGGQPLVEMDASAASEMAGMSKMKGYSMMMAAVKLAGASVGRDGYLTVSTECVAFLPPDFIYSALAKSSSPKIFNAKMEAECKKSTVRTLKNTIRLDEDTAAVAEATICIIGSVLGLFFPAFDDSLIETLKTIVSGVFEIIPCPSMAARTIETIVHP